MIAAEWFVPQTFQQWRVVSCHEMGWPFCAWKALQSEAMVTGHEVLGKKRRGRCAWNFRASERRAELVRAMPSAAENLKEEALRRRTGFQSRTAIQKFCSCFTNRKQTLSPFPFLRRAWFCRLQFLRFCFFGNFESLGKYNANGLAKNSEAEKKNDFVSSFQLSYMSAKTIV